MEMSFLYCLLRIYGDAYKMCVNAIIQSLWLIAQEQKWDNVCNFLDSIESFEFVIIPVDEDIDISGYVIGLRFKLKNSEEISSAQGDLECCIGSDFTTSYFSENENYEYNSKEYAILHIVNSLANYIDLSLTEFDFADFYEFTENYFKDYKGVQVDFCEDFFTIRFADYFFEISFIDLGYGVSVRAWSAQENSEINPEREVSRYYRGGGMNLKLRYLNDSDEIDVLESIEDGSDDFSWVTVAYNISSLLCDNYMKSLTSRK